MAVLQFDADPVDVHNGAAEAGGGIFQHKSVRRLDDAQLAWGGTPGEPGERVSTITVGSEMSREVA
ncbi:hypothetical protein GCM10027052_11600 [Parafrigoribacterium mesophilum]